ncbi:glutamine-hydrolyzing carbamoyl-phosphate synthase small subunit [Candidatus Micrarchaeota archaeon]|nr:glutamine-hydrolyzing carbamoyl-phosphate synthase small subunit [Candidatus Micrarchaeota archaeon]
MQTNPLADGTNQTGSYSKIFQSDFKNPKTPNAILVLKDGSHFLGGQIGAVKEILGELVFNTSMVGYQEALTDPSYAGQILTFCYPLIGNYATNLDDAESEKVHVRAAVVRENCESGKFYHFKAKLGLSEYLKENDVPGISGVDTRSIVRKVRESGVMPSILSPLEPNLSEKQLQEKISELKSKISGFDYGSVNFVSEVSIKQKKIFSPKKIDKKVALIDCGVKLNIIRELNLRNIEATAFPYDISANTILKGDFDGVLISNGPGDPALMKETISTTKKLIQSLPTLGICLGHQLIAHALGGTTYKLKFGHRGSNHAVLNPETGKIYITTQNHGYAAKDIPQNLAQTLFINCNDKTNEGIRHKTLPVISAQFHPEGSNGPKDANFLFDEFLKMMK